MHEKGNEMNEYEITAQVVFTVWAEDEEAARLEARYALGICSFVDVEDVDLVTEEGFEDG